MLSGKGQLSGLAMTVVIALVALFIGLFMISMVSDITEISNDSELYSVFTYLQDQTSTVFKVLVLVIIIVALGVAINVLRGWGGTSAGGGGGEPSV